MSPQTPKLGGKYKILEKLHEGGMGAIYKAEHQLLGAERVIKLIRPQFADDAKFRRRFHEEARSATQLDHPNIAKLYDFSVSEDGTTWIIMEYIQGLSLREILQGIGPPDLSLTLEIARQSLRALGFLHRKGWVHRDISPDNIMLTEDVDHRPLVKLIDLGIAKNMASGSDLTSAGYFFAKMSYSSPEHYKKSGTEARSDLYSFGLVLYELLTGRLAIQGSDPHLLMRAHLEDPPLPFETSDPAGRIPEELRRATLQVLAKTPEERFETAEAFADAVAKVASEYPLGTIDMPELFREVHAHQPPRPFSTGQTQVHLDHQFGLETTPTPPGSGGSSSWRTSQGATPTGMRMPSPEELFEQTAAQKAMQESREHRSSDTDETPNDLEIQRTRRLDLGAFRTEPIRRFDDPPPTPPSSVITGSVPITGSAPLPPATEPPPTGPAVHQDTESPPPFRPPPSTSKMDPPPRPPGQVGAPPPAPATFEPPYETQTPPESPRATVDPPALAPAAARPPAPPSMPRQAPDPEPTTDLTPAMPPSPPQKAMRPEEPSPAAPPQMAPPTSVTPPPSAATASPVEQPFEVRPAVVVPTGFDPVGESASPSSAASQPIPPTSRYARRAPSGPGWWAALCRQVPALEPLPGQLAGVARRGVESVQALLHKAKAGLSPEMRRWLGQYRLPLIGVGAALMLTVLLILLWPKGEHAPVPPPVAPPPHLAQLPPPPQAVPPPLVDESEIHPDLETAVECLDEGDVECVETALATIQSDGILLHPHEQRLFDDVQTQLADAAAAAVSGQQTELVERLLLALEEGSIKDLSKAYDAIYRQRQTEPGAFAEYRSQLVEADRILSESRRLRSSRDKEDHLKIITHAARLAKLFPPHADTAQGYRQEAAEAIEAEAAAAEEKGDLGKAKGQLEALREVWSNRSGIDQRIAILEVQLSDDQNIRNIFDRATELAAAGRPDQGLDQLDQLQLDASSPHWSDFETLRSDLESQLTQLDTKPPRIVLAGDGLPSLQKDKPLSVTFVITDDLQVTEAKAWGKAGKEGTWLPLELENEGDRYELVISPEVHANKWRFEIYIEAFDRSRNRASYGERQSPHLIRRKLL